MAEKFVVDAESVRGLAKLLEETGLTEVEYQAGSQRVRLVKATAPSTPIVHSVPLPSPSPINQPHHAAEAPVSAPSGENITSPMVGTAYLSPEPEAAPFIKAGDSVKKGDTLLIIEAMKVMNPIRAPRDGKVLKVCVSNAIPVEFGEALVILE